MFPWKVLFQKTPYEIERLINKLLFGIEFASCYYSKKTKINIADKAKPRVIVGRKATGP
jgi:hypothetical protein